MFILENIETGQTQQIEENKGVLPKGWRVKAFIPPPKFEHEAKLAVWAAKHKLPIALFLDAARWLLDKDCPFCQMGTQVLRRIGELGEEKATFALTQILIAKEQNNLERLEQIRKWCSEPQELPPQS